MNQYLEDLIYELISELTVQWVNELTVELLDELIKCLSFAFQMLNEEVKTEIPA